ncbi:MAG: sigma-54-dependent Fis family transcriptional regulator [Planctomycetes bacterium]|nr:sigma-54-dependent Fis family transcriptional regulator [Planctomycetota bacterium]
MRTVLVVDDKEMLREGVSATLERAGFAVRTAADGVAALEQVSRERPDAIVTDMRMPGMTGVELLERVRQIDDELPVVLMTAFGTIETAVRAMRMGAFDYLTKPFEGDELVIAVKRALEHRAVMRENALLRAARPTATPTAGRIGLGRLIGESDGMKRLRDSVAALADSQGTVLITGESGVGKEVVARAVHECSPRREGPFLAVNCAALSESLLESELFGHEKGAFTGADKLRKGRFELADGGTLLLDEISEIGPAIQAKLLRVLQERAFERVGSSLPMGVDVRVVGTSNRDLPASVAKGDFRQDLFFRLNVLPIHIPPLRERREDVPLLAEHFVREIARREGRPPLAIDAAARDALVAYHWPGNVRELQNICERAVVLSGPKNAAGGTGVIRRELIEGWLNSSLAPIAPSSVQPPAAAPVPAPMIAPLAPQVFVHAPQQFEPKAISEPRPLEELEREAILSALQRYQGHRVRTARALGIGVRTLGLKLKKWKGEGLVAETV